MSHRGLLLEALELLVVRALGTHDLLLDGAPTLQPVLREVASGVAEGGELRLEPRSNPLYDDHVCRSHAAHLVLYYPLLVLDHRLRHDPHGRLLVGGQLRRLSLGRLVVRRSRSQLGRQLGSQLGSQQLSTD